jgi:ABC-type phosphate transport system substrate-binding protein
MRFSLLTSDPISSLPRSLLSRRRGLTLVGLCVAAAIVPCASGLARADEAAEFRVIVHPSNPLHAVARAHLADAFLKKVTRWHGGEVIRAVDLRADNPVRRRFSERVLKRSVGAVRSYWQQRIFSGRDVPPPELDSDDSVAAFVAKYPGALGYVSGAAKLANVRELAIE